MSDDPRDPYEDKNTFYYAHEQLRAAMADFLTALSDALGITRLLLFFVDRPLLWVLFLSVLFIALSVLMVNSGNIPAP